MTRTPTRHLTDEELALIADGFMSEEEMETHPHLSSCHECQRAVLEALRGLSILSLSSEPPSDMESHVRARRWAAAHDRSLQSQPNAVEDIAEVAGRDMDADPTPEDSPPGTKTPPGND